jgi:ATP/maltotriose-dependent transcriptional regulator MalT
MACARPSSIGGSQNRFSPAGNPIGASIPFGAKQQLTVVGVVEQARMYDVHQDGRPQLYISAEDWQYRPLNYIVRASHITNDALTEREVTVLRLVTMGKANKEVAYEFGLAEKTIKAHLKTIFSRDRRIPLGALARCNRR